MASLGAMSVEITADTSGIQRGERQAKTSLANIGQSARVAVTRLAALGAAAAAAGAALAVKFYKDGAAFIDQQAKMARSLDGSIDGLRALQIAASDAGVSAEAAAASAQMLNYRLAEAARGTGTAAEALERLGLRAKDLQAMDTDQRMAALADRMREMNYSAGQAQDALRDLGIRNREMALMLIDGGDALRAARQEVEDFGLSLSEVDAAKVEAANDAMSRIGRVMEGIKNQITIAFAPAVQVLSDRFNDVARANQGFGAQATRAAEIAATAFGKVMDVFRGLHVVIKGLELVVIGVGRVFNSVSLTVWEGFSRLIDGMTKGINAVIRGMNRLGAGVQELPMMGDSDFMQSARQFDKEFGDLLSRKAGELHDLAMADMPSATIARFFDDVRARSQEMAEQVVADRKRIASDENAIGAASEAAFNEALARRIESIREAGLTETEMLWEKHQRELEILRQGLEENQLTREEYQELERQSTERHEKSLTDINRREEAARRQIMQSSFAQIGTLMNQENKKLFRIGQAAAIANATMSTYEGINKALSLGPIIGPALAAGIAAAGFANVRAIASQKPGGGGAGSPATGGGSAADPTGATSSGGGAGPQRTLMVQGNFSADQMFTGDTVRGLIDAIAEQQKDGYKVVI